MQRSNILYNTDNIFVKKKSLHKYSNIFTVQKVERIETKISGRDGRSSSSGCDCARGFRPDSPT